MPIAHFFTYFATNKFGVVRYWPFFVANGGAVRCELCWKSLAIFTTKQRQFV